MKLDLTVATTRRPPPSFRSGSHGGGCIGSWMDSFGTGMMVSFGSGKPTANEMVFRGQSIDCMTGGDVKFTGVVRIQDHDHHSYELWHEGPGGREFRTMRVTYTRK